MGSRRRHPDRREIPLVESSLGEELNVRTVAMASASSQPSWWRRAAVAAVTSRARPASPSVVPDRGYRRPSFRTRVVITTPHERGGEPTLAVLRPLIDWSVSFPDSESVRDALLGTRNVARLTRSREECFRRSTGGSCPRTWALRV